MIDPLSHKLTERVFVKNGRTSESMANNIAKILISKKFHNIKSGIIYKLEHVKDFHDKHLYPNKQCFDIHFYTVSK